MNESTIRKSAVACTAKNDAGSMGISMCSHGALRARQPLLLT